MKNTIFNLEKIIASIVTCRDTINDLEVILKRSFSRNIELDFSGIEFISRSATHELLLVKERLENRIFNKKSIIFSNMNIDVSEMIRTVAANRVAPRRHSEDQKSKIVSAEQFLSQKS